MITPPLELENLFPVDSGEFLPPAKQYTFWFRYDCSCGLDGGLLIVGEIPSWKLLLDFLLTHGKHHKIDRHFLIDHSVFQFTIHGPLHHLPKPICDYGHQLVNSQ